MSVVSEGYKMAVDDGTSWLTTAEAAIRADQDRVTREGVLTELKTLENPYDESMTTFHDGFETFRAKINLQLAHLSANTTKE